MDKDLIIGAASNYTWDDLKYWVNSIKQTGFTGDIAIVATNITKETIDKLTSEGVQISAYGKQTEDGGFVSDNKIAPHVERFFYIWNHLQMLKDRYRYAIVTDTRDVIFQANPSPYLEETCFVRPLIGSSEGLRYVDEPWGHKNIEETFGKYFMRLIEGNLILNVGVIGGHADYVRDLMLMIFQMSINRPIPIVDQAVYNFLVAHQPYSDALFIANNKEKWAVQLGTTKYAIEAGSGDIGRAAMNDPAAMDLYLNNYLDIQPEIKGHEVLNENGEKYCIVHQYDRVPSLLSEVIKHYGT